MEPRSQPATATLDPLLSEQWYIVNRYSFAGQDRQGLNVGPVWDMGIEGEGVTVSIADDGIDVLHEDLAGAVIDSRIHDYRGVEAHRAIGELGGSHGTMVAGVIAGEANNGRGGRGVSPRVRLVVNNVARNPTPENVSDAMIRDLDVVDIINSSWGAANHTGRLLEPYQGWSSAVAHGLVRGRNGRGVIYVRAAGNGGIGDVDNANYDGYTNARGTIAVAAVGHDGKRIESSEQGANILVSAFARGRDGIGIVTTDLRGASGYNDGSEDGDFGNLGYTKKFGGTSAAAPMVSGVVALLLCVNPDLGWRDVPVILARTARRNDPGAPEWAQNGAGHWVHPAYGFGVVDAHAAVQLAQHWKNVGGSIEWDSGGLYSDAKIPDNSMDWTLVSAYARSTGIQNVEWVSIEVDIDDHFDFGEFDIELRSPSGTISQLANMHRCLEECGEVDSWVFSSVRHIDEKADGAWVLAIRDGRRGREGTLRSWRLRLHGAGRGQARPQ